MRDMKNTKRIAITLVLVGVFCGTFALAQTAAPKPVDWTVRAEAATKERLGQLIYYYKPTADQQAKLKSALIAQYKDLMNHDKISAPKIKALDEEVAAVNVKVAVLDKEIAAVEKKKAELAEEIAAIAKRKGAYSTARGELLLDHKAEISNVFTREQKIARLSSYIKRNAVGSQYLAVLPKATQESLGEQCDAAAVKLLEAGKGDDTGAVYAAYRKVHDANKAILTPEVRRAGDVKYYMDSTMRKFARLKLTETQKAAVRDMCEKAVKHKADVQAQYSQVSAKYAQASKDRSALRSAISRMSSSSYYYKIRADVVEKVLTDAQLKQAGYKRKSSTPRKKR